MLSKTCLSLICSAALMAAGSSHALGADDPVGDYVPGYLGNTAGGVDVINAFVTYNASTDIFVFSATMANDISSTPLGFFVWGLDRGAGTARFAGQGIDATHPNGIDGVLFDSVVTFRQTNTPGGATGSVTTLVPTPPTAQGSSVSAQIFGSTIVGTVSGSLLPSLGRAKSAYTWNLWPRDGAITFPPGANNFAQISDFAPDNSNLMVRTVGVVPEPTTTAMMLAGGLAMLALGARRRRQG